ncbi:MAG: NfeD family protein [Gammaproteobacteria bacterium]|nr:NfeD family protein [Gammaproteobacteria bacterium]
MIEYFNNHQYAFWFTAGFIMLALEALVLGFAIGIVLFSGLGALLTGALIWLGIVPSSWIAGIASFGLCSVAITAILWKPFKKLQDNNNHISTKDYSSDLIGYSFRLSETITHTRPGNTRYSGITWRVEIEDTANVEEITAGQKVEVYSVDAGVFRVKMASDRN